jgi:RNA polymerase sigma factor for flagellar operon FliA
MPTRDELVAEHISLAEAQAKLIHKRHARSAELADMVADAKLGLVQASVRYEDDRAVEFATFAYYRIRGAIFDGLRRSGKLSTKSSAEVEREAAADQGVEISGEVLEADGGVRSGREAYGIAINEAVASMIAGFTYELIQQEDAVSNPEDALIEEDEKYRVNRAIDELEVEDAHLLRALFYEGKRQEDLAPELNLTRSAVSKRLKVALVRMREALTR